LLAKFAYLSFNIKKKQKLEFNEFGHCIALQEKKLNLSGNFRTY